MVGCGNRKGSSERGGRRSTAEVGAEGRRLRGGTKSEEGGGIAVRRTMRICGAEDDEDVGSAVRRTMRTMMISMRKGMRLTTTIMIYLSGRWGSQACRMRGPAGGM